LDFYEQARQSEGGESLSRYAENAARDFFPKLTETERQLVLVDGANLPMSALNVLRSLNDLSDAALVSRLIRLDRQITGNDTPAAKQLATGIAALLGLSRDDEAMAHLRDVFRRQPERRDELAMALAQSPDGENWLLLVDALPVLEQAAAREVLNRLTEVSRTPDGPEPLRQAILAGLRLQEDGYQQAVYVLEHWTGRRLTAPDDTWEIALAAWQDWFRAEYPDQPDPALPQDAAGTKWRYDELLEYLTAGGAEHGDAVRGAAVFEKAACAKCHRYDGRGEAIGPDLTTVSLRFRKQEILEAILFPSHVISDQYASQTVETDDGKTYTGIVGSAGEDAVVILQANAEKVTVPKSQIVGTYPAQKSAMPDGLLNELTLEEIADLFAYLGTTPQVSLEAKRR
jgi:putative heme-binding domain-containing protein